MQTKKVSTRKIRLDLESIEVISAETMNPETRGGVQMFGTDALSCKPDSEYATCQPIDTVPVYSHWCVTGNCGTDNTCGSCPTYCVGLPCTG